MATGNRIGGMLTMKVNGQQYEARGNFTVHGMSLKRTGVAGQDYVHGFIEEPEVPAIKGDWSIGKQLSLVALEAITDATAQIALANGMSYVLTDCWSIPPFTIDAHDGKVEVAFGGLTMQELPTSS